jgi:hypothetical protein
MEVIAIVGGIAGIVQLAAQGMKIIDHLKTEFHYLKTEVDEDVVLQTLVAGGQLLQDVQALCGRYEKAKLEGSGNIRVATLKLHLEDCVKDLVSMETTCRRQYTSNGPRWRSFFGTSNYAGRGQMLRKWNQFRIGFEQHQVSLGVALSIVKSQVASPLKVLSTANSL